MADEVISTWVAFCLFFVILDGFGVIFEQHVLDANSVECQFYTLIVSDEQHYLKELLKIRQTVFNKLAVMQQHSLCVVVSRLLLYIFGSSHTFGQYLQIFEFASYLDLTPHPLYYFFLVRLLLLLKHVFILESGNIEVVGQSNSVGFADIESVFMLFGGDVVDLCDGGRMMVQVVVAHHAARRVSPYFLLVVYPSHVD